MSRDRGSSMRDARGRPTRGGRARQFHLNRGFAQSNHAQDGSRLTEQRLVPFEAVRHVAYPYESTCASSRPLLQTNSCLDRPGYNEIAAASRADNPCAYIRF